jgi:glycosyltransferase involved in cell wall biosynthesis
MKVLFIGHYKERGGWAQASKDYILAMQEAGIDVVCRNITLTQDNDPGYEILKLEKKSIQNVDFCIQHLLPHHLVGTSQFKRNISIVDLESYDIKDLTWYRYLQMMDEVWVPNNDSANSLKKHKDFPEVLVIPHCTDTEKYTTNHGKLNYQGLDGKFKFYYIGDLNDRKNLRSAIRCYESEFTSKDPTIFVIKVNKFGMSDQQVYNLVGQMIQEERNKIRLSNNPNYFIIPSRLDDQAIMALHQMCDCFVCPSHGEAWSIPAFDAMGFGNTPICSKFGGPNEFISSSKNCGTLVNGVYSICQCSDAAFPEIFTGREYWFQPCEKEIREAMRFYFEDRFNKVAHKASGLSQTKNFSYEKIGKKIKDRLNELSNS